MTDTNTMGHAQPIQVTDEVEFHFVPSREFPRRLTVIRSKYYLTVVVYPRAGKAARYRMLAYASIARDSDGIRLHINEHGDCDLWLGGTAFGVTESEFSQLAEKLGIRVTRHEGAQQ